MPKSFQTLRSRLIISFCIIIISCVTLISIIGNYYFQKETEEQNTSYTLQLLYQVSNYTDSYIQETVNTLALLAKEDVVVDFMNIGQATEESDRLEKESALRGRLREYTSQLNQVEGIVISCESGRYISNEFYRVTKNPLNGDHWYRQTAALPADGFYLASRPMQRNLRNWREYSIYDVVMLNYPVYDQVNGAFLGVISVDLKLEPLSDALSELTLGKKGTIFLLDEESEVVYSPINPLVYRVRREWFGEGSNGAFVAPVQGELMTFLYSSSQYNGWKTVGMFLTDAKPDAAVSLQGIIFVVAVFTLGFGILMAIILTRTVTQPISNLQSLMKKAEQGDFSVEYVGNKNNSYDVDMLGNSFNTMVTQISQLLVLVVEEQKQKRKAEMGALQAQINPHFLYNTLDTIHWMAAEYDAHDIVDSISALTRLFRISLSKGREFISLKDELTHVESYLFLQRMRYEEKLNYTLTADESLLSAVVLKLSVQPIVENAIYHGIKPKAGNGNIAIKAYREGNDLLISVEDDGVGLSDEKLARLRRELGERKNRTGFGMFNVSERLLMHFGAGYGLDLGHSQSGGVVCTIRQPLVFEAPDE